MSKANTVPGVFNKAHVNEFIADSVHLKGMSPCIQRLISTGFFIGIIINACATGGDSLNRVDSAGKRQGYWKIYGTDLKKPGFKQGQIYEEGIYLGGMKQGTWISYHDCGVIKNILSFQAGRIQGYSQMYAETGVLLEEGYWEMNRWKRAYKAYHENGNRKYDFFYNNSGKREGTQKYYRADGKLFMQAEYENGNCKRIEEFDEKGIIIRSDSTITGRSSTKHYAGDHYLPFGKSDTISKQDRGTASAPMKLYNSKKKLVMEGIFKNYKLIEGKIYCYNKKGKLERLALYKNGEFIGYEDPPPGK